MKELKATVKWFDPRKGQGYAVSDELESDIMIHFSTIEMEGFKIVKPHDEVTIKGYTLTPDGYRAERTIPQ